MWSDSFGWGIDNQSWLLFLVFGAPQGQRIFHRLWQGVAKGFWEEQKGKGTPYEGGGPEHQEGEGLPDGAEKRHLWRQNAADSRASGTKNEKACPL